MIKLLKVLVIIICSFNITATIAQNRSFTGQPNPFSDSILFQINNLQNDTVSLRILNVQGSEEATIYDSVILSGSITKWYDGSSLSNGVYFAILTVNDSNKTIKTIKNDSITYLQEHTPLTEFQIFPNPATDYIKIPTIENIRQLQIYNVRGKLMNSIAQPRSVIDISSLAKGTYIIELIGSHQTFTEKIIKL